MAEDYQKLLEENNQLLKKINEQLEKQRRLRIWMLVISLIVVILPLLVAIIALPWIMDTMNSYYGNILSL